MKKTNLLRVLAGLVLALSLTGCPKPTDEPAKPQQPVAPENPSATDLIKLNLTGAKALGSVYNKGIGASRSARAADDKASSDQLLKFDPEGNAESVMENVYEDKKMNFSTFEQIMEIKKNPYSNIPDYAKGTYITFENINWRLEYTDGTDAPQLGQLIYVKPDGSLVDLSKDDYLDTGNTAWNGYDYIEFANDGRAFFILSYWNETTRASNTKIKCFDPKDDSITDIPLGITSNYNMEDFRINDDGSWLFAGTREELEYNEAYDAMAGILHVYAIPTANPAAKISLYTQATNDKVIPNLDWEGLTLGNKIYSIGQISYDSKTKTMVFGVGSCGPLYLTNAKRFYYWDNGYSATNADFFETLRGDVVGGWLRYYKDELKLPEDEVYEKIAKNIKNYCSLKHSDYNPAEGSSDDIEINLSYFKDKPEYAELYDPDAKDGAAVKILIGEPYKVDEGYYKMTSEPLNKFLEDCAKEREAEGYPNDADSWPLEKICFLKDKDGKATTQTAFEQNEDWLKGGFPALMTSIPFATKNGNWGIKWNDVWEGGTYIETYCDIIQITDNDGKFLWEVPEVAKSMKGVDTNRIKESRKQDDPWYKPAYSINENGIAIINKNQDDIYYFDGTNLKLLLKDQALAVSGKIISVSCENNMVFYTAKTDDGKWLNKGISLSDGSVNNLKTDKLLSAIVGM